MIDGRGRLGLVAVLIAAVGPARGSPAAWEDEAQTAPAVCMTAEFVQAAVSAEPSASFSADGQVLAFASYARLLPSDTNSSSDIYVIDLTTGRLTIESLPGDGTAAAVDSLHPRLSGDGRLLVFDTTVRGGSATREARSEPMLRDRALGVTRLVVVDQRGEPGNGASQDAVISADGSTVAFASTATNLGPSSDAGRSMLQVFALSVAIGDIVLVSADAAGRAAADGPSYSPTISDDGRYVAFTSEADLGGHAPSAAAQARPDRRARSNVFVRDVRKAVTYRVSRRADGRAPNGRSYLGAISGDGRSVAFVSDASDLARDDHNRAPDVFLHDLDTSTTILVSRGARGGTASGASTRPAVARDGRVVVFESNASDLVCARRCAERDVDVNLVPDVFLWRRTDAGVIRVSMDAGAGWPETSRLPIVDAEGVRVAFASRHPIGAEDHGQDFDLVVRGVCVPASPDRITSGRQ